MEAHILQTLDREGEIQDTGDFASSSGYDHSAVVSSMNSLQAHDMVYSEVLSCDGLPLPNLLWALL